MKHVALTAQEELNICKQLKISPTQLMFLRVLHSADLPGIMQFQAEIDVTPNDLAHLIGNGLIEDYNKPNEQFADAYAPTMKFIKVYRGKAEEWFEEIWIMFPTRIEMNNSWFNAKSVGVEELAGEYRKVVGSNETKHKQIKQALQRAIDNDVITMGIEKWIKSKQWLVVDDLVDDKNVADSGIDI